MPIVNSGIDRCAALRLRTFWSEVLTSVCNDDLFGLLGTRLECEMRSKDKADAQRIFLPSSYEHHHHHHQLMRVSLEIH